MLGEAGQDKLVQGLLATVQDLVEHLDSEAGWDVLVLLEELDEFLADGGASVHFSTLELGDVKVDESMVLAEVGSDLLLQARLALASSDVDHAWLDVSVDLADGLVEVLVGADLDEVGVLLQEWHQVLGMVVELLDLLGKNGRAHIERMVLSKVDHSLLADVFGALQREHVRWVGAVSQEVLRLELVVREILKNQPWSSLTGQALDEVRCDRLVILVFKAVLLDEVVEVDQLGVGPG